MEKIGYTMKVSGYRQLFEDTFFKIICCVQQKKETLN